MAQFVEIPSYGYGTTGKIYERLRKRSYRARIAPWRGWGNTPTNNLLAHSTYIDGVRDALKALALEVAKEDV